MNEAARLPILAQMRSADRLGNCLHMVIDRKLTRTASLAGALLKTGRSSELAGKANALPIQELAVKCRANNRKVIADRMAKSSKLVAIRRGKVLLVRRRKDGLWMFPGGQKLSQEDEKACLRREIKEELPKLKLGRMTLWKDLCDEDCITHFPAGILISLRHFSLAQATPHPSDPDLALYS